MPHFEAPEGGGPGGLIPEPGGHAGGPGGRVPGTRAAAGVRMRGLIIKTIVL